jgi:hypothetical protein
MREFDIPLTKRFAVYVDLTEDGLVPFYAGKAIQARLNDLARNFKHDNVAAKHGCIRILVLETDDEREALDKEIEVIADARLNHYRHPDCPWASNFTDGGDGSSGRKFSEESLRKIGARKPGRKTTKGHKMCDEQRKKLQTASSFNRDKGKPKTPEHRAKLSATNRGRKMSDAARQAMRDGWARRREQRAQENAVSE